MWIPSENFSRDCILLPPGNSTIVSIDGTFLNVHYHYLDPKGSSTQQDTIRTDVLSLRITPEVSQINYIQNNNQQLLSENDTTFVKSPV